MRRLRIGALLCLAVASSSCHRAKEKRPEHAVSRSDEDKPVPVTTISVGDPKYASRLLAGFYDGTPAWKWTGQTFAVQLDRPESTDDLRLILDFSAPVELMSVVRGVTVSAKVNGVDVGKEEYHKDGRYYFVHNVPRKALERDPVKIEFSLDKVAKTAEGKPLGLIAVGVTLEPREDPLVDRGTEVRMARAAYRELLEQRNRTVPVDKQHEMMKLFHDIPIWAHMWFQNVQIEKNPLDLWMMQQIIYEVQPDFIVETGTFRGGSALYWAHTLNGMGLDRSRVITVDIQDLTRTAATHPLWKKYVTFFRGSSTDAKIVSDIGRLVQGHKAVVTLDSDHSMQHVLNELHAYAPMVPSRSYLVVEDTHIDGVPTQPGFGPGPLTAVQKFLSEATGKDFEQDLTREAFIMTFNPGGWLRRK